MRILLFTFPLLAVVCTSCRNHAPEIQEVRTGTRVKIQKGAVTTWGTAFARNDAEVLTNLHIDEGGQPYVEVSDGVWEKAARLSKDPNNDILILENPGIAPLKQGKPVKGPATIYASNLGKPAQALRGQILGITHGMIDTDIKIEFGASGAPIIQGGKLVGYVVGFDAQTKNARGMEIRK